MPPAGFEPATYALGKFKGGAASADAATGNESDHPEKHHSDTTDERLAQILRRVRTCTPEQLERLGAFIDGMGIE